MPINVGDSVGNPGEDLIYSMLASKKREEGHSNAKNNKRKGVTEVERLEMVRLGLLKKKEFEAKSLTIVERLIDPEVNKEWLRDSVFFLNPEKYDDVTVERALTKICGYPLCRGQLGPVKKQQYHISLKDNKVYDITERKNFCSNLCFKGSNYFKKQIPTSPLWLREREKKVKVVFLDESEVKSTSGKGTVVPFPIAQKPSEDDIVPEELTVPPKVDREEDLLEQLEELNIRDKESTKQLPEDFKPTIRREKKVKKKPEIPAKQKVEACLEEWFTIDTLRVLFGDSHVKEVLMERGCAMDKILSTLGDDTFENPEFKEQYIQLCRNLDMREKLEEKAVMDELDPSPVEKAATSKPLPSYDELKKQSETELLKVGSFLKGKTEIVIHEKNTDKKSDAGSVDEGEVLVNVPLIDKHAQGALRRRIVHDQLERTLPDILKICQLTQRDINPQFRKLVQSFAFTAQNIVLNLNDWTLVSIFVPVMLSKKMPLVEKALSKESVSKSLNLILLAYGTDLAAAHRYVGTLHSDVHKLVRKMQHNSVG